MLSLNSDVWEKLSGPYGSAKMSRLVAAIGAGIQPRDF